MTNILKEGAARLEVIKMHLRLGLLLIAFAALSSPVAVAQPAGAGAPSGLTAQQTPNERPLPTTGTYMQDPIFFVGYDTRYVHFDEAPVSTGRLCRDGLPKWKQIWVYAELKSDDAVYFVINGRLSDGTLDPYVDGLAIKLKGTQCIVDRENIFNTNPGATKRILAPQPVLRGLVEDLLRRYTAAFGGKQKFLQAVSRNPKFRSGDLWDPVRIPFEQFAKSP